MQLRSELHIIEFLLTMVYIRSNIETKSLCREAYIIWKAGITLARYEFSALRKLPSVDISPNIKKPSEWSERSGSDFSLSSLPFKSVCE